MAIGDSTENLVDTCFDEKSSTPKSKSDRKIPQALANDNFIGYAHRFLVDEGVTWLEATIAGPVFSGLVTYYIEGKNSERHHMMESAVGKPERAWGVRGNLFSFSYCLGKKSWHSFSSE